MNNTNQIIHERLMGECWNDWIKHITGWEWKCVKCSETKATRAKPENPQYNADLNLAFAAQAKAIERFGDEYTYTVFEILGLSGSNDLQKNYGKLVEADAKTRCAAIVKLLENENA